MLTPEILLAGYSSGIFPMAVNSSGDLGWFSPDPRALIPLDERFRVPHGVRRALKRNTSLDAGSGDPAYRIGNVVGRVPSRGEVFLRVEVDTRFDEVIRACAASHGETWISKEIITSYSRLHELGHAHSIEVLNENGLVGGLYGVQIGGAFFGESMFHQVPNASNIALVALVERLRARHFLLLDTQWMTPHLAIFGTYLVPKTDYLQLLQEAIAKPCKFT